MYKLSKIQKLVLASKFVFFDENDNLIEANLKEINRFLDNNIYIAVLASDQTISRLKEKLPEEYRDKLRFISRNRENKDKIKKFKNEGRLIAMLGVVNADAFYSFNCKLPIFNPENIIKNKNSIGEKIKEYGLPIASLEDVLKCMITYDIHKDNYFEYDSGDHFNVISLNSANTYYKSEDEVKIKEIFKTNLKADIHTREHRVLLILLFHLMNELTKNHKYNEVNFWGTFPSADSNNTDTSISFIKEAIRVIVNGKPQKGAEILIRHTSMKPKKMNNNRSVIKCQADFDTLMVNPDLIDKINGKTVCIIDDYITKGYSAEATKHLLFEAGVEKVIFISVGKFGKDYFDTDYQLDGDITASYNFNFINEVNIGSESRYNSHNDKEILEFLNIID